jgi:hypothetical protein
MKYLQEPCLEVSELGQSSRWFNVLEKLIHKLNDNRCDTAYMSSNPVNSTMPIKTLKLIQCKYAIQQNQLHPIPEDVNETI